MVSDTGLELRDLFLKRLVFRGESKVHERLLARVSSEPLESARMLPTGQRACQIILSDYSTSFSANMKLLSKD